MATTNDRALNRKIVEKARKMKSYAYASDDPEVSDFAHPSVINVADTVQIAISTGGSSPATVSYTHLTLPTTPYV